MNKLIIPCETGQVSDGFHTFDELYDHRCHLFTTLINLLPNISWWSKLHHDGTLWEGWIIAGIDLPNGTITYHMPQVMIHLLPEKCELDKGKEWDGHTSNDVINRLAAYCETGPSCRGYETGFYDGRHGTPCEQIKSEHENEKLTDILDLMRDEFKRIKVCPGVTSEIIGLCERAITTVTQNVPVIVQRDKAEEQLAKIKSNLYNDADGLYLHTKSKFVYKIVCIALDATSKDPTVIYQSIETGQTWSRSHSEFFDGRFMNIKLENL